MRSHVQNRINAAKKDVRYVLAKRLLTRYYNQLKYRKLLTINISINKKDLLGDKVHTSYIMIPNILFHRIYEPNTFLWPSDSGHLGLGIGYAIGAQLAKPDKKVYAIMGDGSFMFNVQELETARRLKLPVVIIVINDQAYGMIKAGQKLAYKQRYIGVDFFDVRYDKLAESMDCFGIRIKNPQEIKPALEKALDVEIPAILDVVVDREINLEPPDFETLASIWLEGCDLPE